MAVLHQHMPHEAELGFFAFALLEQPGLGVGGGGVRLVQPLLPMKVHFRVAAAAAFGGRGVLGAETLQGGPSLNQSAACGEMLVRQQSGGLRLRKDAGEKGRRQIESRKRSRFLEKTEWSQTLSSMESPTNQRNRRL